ncbi:MAG TPA: hypothetical protein DCQ58_09060, partial [Saprospirales bacterium]|nr:hypothetical protein [Saprospirales bacterium]
MVFLPIFLPEHFYQLQFVSKRIILNKDIQNMSMFFIRKIICSMLFLLPVLVFLLVGDVFGDAVKPHHDK